MGARNAEYMELLRDPRWQKKRLRILKRDMWRCVWCHDSDRNLQVDHKHYQPGRPPWDVADPCLQTLCDRCHERITLLRKRIRELVGEFNVYELPLLIATIERVWEDSPRAKGIDAESYRRPAINDGMGALVAENARARLVRLESEKASLTGVPYSRSASRRVDEIDATLAEFWDAIGADAMAAAGD